jgi:hypothetical protein
MGRLWGKSLHTKVDVTKAAGADLATDAVLITHAEILWKESQTHCRVVGA